ncbi:AbrB/MazE/SpoVT family DNA-binding domain-containing protein [Solibacillus sp. FSL H8-0538]|uniref:AbrB/MazE/SpoVT family DNA-binding domain-containing protein n=1 Tax=Solibacillus sp. FSL H8-0538 TaxID=2921400 RepID=UPI0030F6AA92
MNQEDGKGWIFMTTATVRKWGNSLAVRIPQDVSEKVKFTDGVEIEMYVNEDQEILLRPIYPAADDQEDLRKHFLSIRAKCKQGMPTHEEIKDEPMGDEII